MSERHAILLSPYRFPGQDSTYLSDDDVRTFLNAHAALWHPVALHNRSAPPRIDSPYDHEQPSSNFLYATPRQPPLLLPDGWEERVQQVGSLSFAASTCFQSTLEELIQVFRPRYQGQPEEVLLHLPVERFRPFLGIGLGYAVIEALFEAMAHEKQLDGPGFWQDVHNAVQALLEHPTDNHFRVPLQAAADKLLAARETLYPVAIHVLDLVLLEEQPDLTHPWPAAWTAGLAVTILASAGVLSHLPAEQLAALRARVGDDHAEVCGGCLLERADAHLPLESQLWNFRAGQRTYEELLGQPVRVHARRRFGCHPHTPLLLQSHGITRALKLSLDESVIPTHRSTLVNWPSPDGKQVEAFTRTPHAVDSPQVGFHLAHHLHRTIMQDQAATLPLLHRHHLAEPWYADWVELSRFAPVLGRWTTLSGYFNEVISGEYSSPAEPDEFHDDYLVERTAGLDGTDPEARPGPWTTNDPISGFAAHQRARRQLDATLTLAALYRGLTGKPVPAESPLETRLEQLEHQLEKGPLPMQDLDALQREAASAIANRLVARGPAQEGVLILNPCSFKRRVVVEIPDLGHLLPLNDPIKACQLDGSLGRVVVEVPALGFAWVPARGEPGTELPARRMKLADPGGVRNEFFEAEIDPNTGGMRFIRDLRTRTGRLGQQLVFNPGSTMKATNIQVTSTGPALGEVITEGILMDANQEEIARFRQRFQAWLGRPVLDLRIEIEPLRELNGFPWHAYYGSRFAWREDRTYLLRGCFGASQPTSHTRPVTPDFLELRSGQKNTVLFPGGLPFHQRHGSRMLDVLLIAPGEECRQFDLAIGIDRPLPAQTAQGMITPTIAVPTTQGPPHVGASGWLFHLDAPQVLLTSLRPARDGQDAIIARLLECGGHGGMAEFRCVRNPTRALLEDALGNSLYDVPSSGDACTLDLSRSDLINLRVEFS